MILNSDDLKRLCGIAIEAAKRSGTMIQSYAGSDFVIEDKNAGSSPSSQIVTEVDMKSEEMILNLINPTLETFDLGLLTEETEDDLSRFEKDYFWCIDPLDGTLPFIKQQPGYAVSIALVSREGVAVIGVIYNPVSKTLYHAIKNLGAFRNESTWVLESDYAGTYKTLTEGGAVINACRALEDAPACFMKKPKTEDGGGCVWDYAATTCLFEEMGAVASDSHGKALDLNPPDSLFMNRKGVLFASHQEIVNAIRSSRD